jgi:hypothetical protein
MEPARQATVTFSEDVAPIIFTRCASCHRPGEATPFSLLGYEDVRQRGRFIASVTGTRYMPPWHADTEMGVFRDDRRLTDSEIRTIGEWVAGGMPEGDPALAPDPPEFTPGWQLGEPDLIVRMAERFQIPEDGPDLFRNFAIPLNLGEERWVRAVEFRPSGNASHHALFFLDSTGQALRMDAEDPAPGFEGMDFLDTGDSPAAGRGRGGLLQRLRGRAANIADGAISAIGGWAVGGTPAPLPEGTSRRLRANSDLVLQMHFHPTGKPEIEQAVIGIYFADGPPERTLLGLQLPPLFGAFAGIDIPPGTERFVISDSFVLPIDVEVVGGGAHAHYLSTDMRMTATLPDGTVRELLGIPNWDFNWQERYYFERPVVLRAGTRLEVEIAYDNTRDNPSNPFDPPRRVTFGRESTDEMGSMTLELLPARESDLPEYASAVREHLQDAVVRGLIDLGRGRGRSP